ncbi:MAG TPA: sporulation initiation inhibitor Soj [Clostridiales bacterium]|nr:sporulation initiation inhibitor Soj [Clostridiales bacterium]
MGKVVSIANQKGGVGKTTTAVNLSTLLAKKGKKVLLIDTDPQGNATSGLGIDKNVELSTYDLLISDVTAEEIIQDTAIKNLDISPSNINLAGAEVQLVSMMSREQRMKEKIDVIKNKYDYIIIDCPPSLGLITLNAFTASDSVLIPVQCEYFALEGLGQLLNTVELVRKHLNKNLYIEGALLTMYDIRTNLANQVVREVKKFFQNKVYKTVIPRNVRVSEAPSYGMPISVYDPKSKGARSYEKFTREFLKYNEAESRS